MLIYSFTGYSWPISLIKELEMQNFIWSGGPQQQKTCYCGWITIFTPIPEGGMHIIS